MSIKEAFEAIREECAKTAENISSDYPESARDTAEAIRAIDISKFDTASQEHKLYTTANSHSFAEVVKDNFGALNVDRCPHCRKQES